MSTNISLSGPYAPIRVAAKPDGWAPPKGATLERMPDGMLMTRREDETHRTIREFFTPAGGRKSWMDPYRKEGLLQTKINNRWSPGASGAPIDQGSAQWLAMKARGEF